MSCVGILPRRATQHLASQRTAASVKIQASRARDSHRCRAVRVWPRPYGLCPPKFTVCVSLFNVSNSLKPKVNKKLALLRSPATIRSLVNLGSIGFFQGRRHCEECGVPLDAVDTRAQSFGHRARMTRTMWRNRTGTTSDYPRQLCVR